jgi:hypothetical protein
MTETPDFEQPNTAESQPEKKRIKVEMSKNHLLVDGRTLEANDDADVIRTALVMGRPVIMAGLEEFKRYQQELNPGAEVSLAPFEAIKLRAGNMRNVSKSLTKEALESKEQVFYERSALHEELYPLWDIVSDSGFVPHVRLFGTRSGWHLGIWGEISQLSEGSRA